MAYFKMNGSGCNPSNESLLVILDTHVHHRDMALEMDLGDVDLAAVGTDVGVLGVFTHVFLQPPLEAEGGGTLRALEHPLRAGVELGVAAQGCFCLENLQKSCGHVNESSSTIFKRRSKQVLLLFYKLISLEQTLC